MTTNIEFKAWLDSPLTKALKQGHKEAMMRFENTRIDKAVKAEREACAKAVINIANEDAGNPYKQALRMGAEAIRARGNT